MHPILIKIFGIPIYSYGLCLSIAFLICITLILRKAVAIGIPPHHILDLALYMVISGIIGARLMYVAMDIEYYMTKPWEIILLNKGGLVFHGGFILALIVGVLVVKARRLPLGQVADIVSLYLPLGQAIGRIGCFLNGCCYGKETNCVLGVQFPEHSFVAHRFGINALVHPTQIYCSLVNLVIFIILGLRIERKRFSGQIFLEYMFLYGTGRFIIEYFRGDNPPVFYGLDIQQIVSITMIIVAIVIYARVQFHNRIR